MAVSTSTQRLDLSDPLLFNFDATVVEHGEWNGSPSALLDRSAFYPESGGQLPDRGTLGGARVVDVQLDDEGRHHHVLDGPVPEVGDSVLGRIDEARRRQHMAQHTGQHMLSWALTELADAPTISSHLGESACTIDVRRKSLSSKELERAADAVNAVINADHEVRLLFPTAEELEQLPLRRRPKVSTGIRVVAIGDFEYVPCGGTHCPRTSQVGFLTILDAIRYKGMTRVTFAAGERARKHLEEHSRLLKDLGLRFTCSPADVPKAINRLERELVDRRDALKSLRSELAGERARLLLEQTASPFVIAELPDADAELLRAVGWRIVASPGRIALLAASSEDGTAIFAAKSDEPSPEHPSTLEEFHCGTFLRTVAQAAGGRGGGRATHAEGRLPAGIDWNELVRRSGLASTS